MRPIKVEFYAGNIILKNLEMLYREFKERYKGKILMRIDYPISIGFFWKNIFHYRKRKMEYFNDVLVDAFIFEPIDLSISQHLIIRSKGMLLYRDYENSRVCSHEGVTEQQRRKRQRKGT